MSVTLVNFLHCFLISTTLYDKPELPEVFKKIKTIRYTKAFQDGTSPDKILSLVICPVFLTKYGRILDEESSDLFCRKKILISNRALNENRFDFVGIDLFKMGD